MSNKIVYKIEFLLSELEEISSALRFKNKQNTGEIISSLEDYINEIIDFGIEEENKKK